MDLMTLSIITLNIMTFSIMTQEMMALSTVTLNISVTFGIMVKNILVTVVINAILVSVILQSAFQLNVVALYFVSTNLCFLLSQNAPLSLSPLSNICGKGWNSLTLAGSCLAYKQSNIPNSDNFVKNSA